MPLYYAHKRPLARSLRATITAKYGHHDGPEDQHQNIWYVPLPWQNKSEKLPGYGAEPQKTSSDAEDKNFLWVAFPMSDAGLKSPCRWSYHSRIYIWLVNIVAWKTTLSESHQRICAKPYHSNQHKCIYDWFHRKFITLGRLGYIQTLLRQRCQSNFIQIIHQFLTTANSPEGIFLAFFKSKTISHANKIHTTLSCAF